jgi:hypothetical protein
MALPKSQQDLLSSGDLPFWSLLYTYHPIKKHTHTGRHRCTIHSSSCSTSNMTSPTSQTPRRRYVCQAEHDLDVNVSSHTKSRNGCETCKRRHIRCDETSPQWYVPNCYPSTTLGTSSNNCPHSNNCTKYKHRCPYQDVLENEQRELTLIKANLLWTSEIEAEIRSWQQTGRSSFPSLCVFPAIPFETFSLEDLRLIYHVASISSELCTSDSSNFTIWVGQVPL